LEKLSNYFQAGIEYFQTYKGSSMLVVLFLISLLYIYMHDNKEIIKRDVFLRYSIVAVLLLFNPLVVYASVNIFFKDTVYWRMFWTVPLVPIIAYAAVQVISKCNEKKKKIISSIAILLIIAYCGKLVYSSGTFQVADNLYKLPQEAIDICGIIHDQEEDGEGVKLLVTPELASYIRQYDGTMLMLFGRNGRGNSPEQARTAYEELGRERIDISLITGIARDTGCNYIVLNSYRLPPDKPGTDALNAFGYISVDVVGDYIIFKDVQ